ncbi:hypothetical protein PENTCL1PPCAC_22674 [Pristionchus entomophagus]|uniref:RRM domain-containing protein n=1 Tax=Pristionchus entomophagus TaxID=358040 RepID=A0AAV5U111_9BILA|nr:hypothetical protein PENTCL1PPCAC_22674 [Pristionchus entomophagus]
MSVIIRLQNLPLTAASSDIRNFFSGQRIPDGAVNIVGGALGEAFIGFVTQQDAIQAMRKNNGRIHNAEIQLFLSSQTEMNEVIAAARSAPAPSINPPSIPPRFGGSIRSPRLEREEASRFPSRDEPPRYGRDVLPFLTNGPSLGRNENPRYGSAGPSPMNGRSSFPPQGGMRPFKNEPSFDEERGGDIRGGDLDRPIFQMQTSSYGSEKIGQRNSNDDGMRGRNEAWNRDGESMGDVRNQRFPPVIRQEDADRRAPIHSRDNSRNDVDERRDNKEESWRNESNRSFERMPALVAPTEKDDSISFFGRGAPPKRPLLPPPSISVPRYPSIPPSNSSSHPPVVQTQKEEVFVELTRLPADLLRPSSLEEFLSPSIPLTLSSVKVVYSPEGIHLSSLVRFTSAMDAFNALKKDGEQGVKIRPSSKESFESARDGPPSSLSHLNPHIPPPLIPNHPPIPSFPPMGGITHQGIHPPNLFTMPLINPNEIIMGNERRGFNGLIDGDDGRGERRRREDSPSRGKREERRRRSNSPRSKKPRVDRICVLVSNLPFRAKEPEIRRMLGPGLNPYAIKKVFNEDNAPSDVWIMEFASEPEAMETVHRRMEMGGRQARLKMIEEPEADKLLRQKFKSPPRRGEREGERRDSFDEKVRMQQEAIEMEKTRMNGSWDSGEKALAGAFSAPVFTANRGFMRGGRGGRGMRGMSSGGMRGGAGMMGTMGRGGERTCLLVSNMPALPAPQVLLEHLRVAPSQLMRVDQIAPDAAIIELRNEVDAIAVAENGEMLPPLNGRRLIVAAMGRRQIEEELNLRARDINNHGKEGDRPNIDPEMIRSVGKTGCVIACYGFPRDLAIDEIKGFLDGFPMIESSVRMRMEGGEGTGECILALNDPRSAQSAVELLHKKSFRGHPVSLFLL